MKKKDSETWRIGHWKLPKGTKGKKERKRMKKAYRNYMTQ